MGKIPVAPVPSGGIGIEWTLLGERTVPVHIDQITKNQQIPPFCETGAYPFLLIVLIGDNFSKTLNSWGAIHVGTNGAGPYISYPSAVAGGPSFAGELILLPDYMTQNTGIYKHCAPGETGDVSDPSALSVGLSSSEKYYSLDVTITQRIYGGKFKF